MGLVPFPHLAELNWTILWIPLVNGLIRAEQTLHFLSHPPTDRTWSNEQRRHQRWVLSNFY